MLGRRPKTPLEERLGYRFRDPGLLELAVTHRSFANERGESDHYERLEFLGDAVLAAAAADWLYRQHPRLPEGDLSQLKGYFVSRPVLAGHARRLGIGGMLRLGVGEERSGGRRKDSLLADVMEAVLGAIFLDGGFEPARKAVQRFLAAASTEQGEDLGRVDAKTRLQELAQARGWKLPLYELVSEDGPDHQKVFTVECRLEEGTAARGSGRSKKIAEQEAAAEALDLIESRDAFEGREL